MSRFPFSTGGLGAKGLFTLPSGIGGSNALLDRGITDPYAVGSFRTKGKSKIIFKDVWTLLDHSGGLAQYEDQAWPQLLNRYGGYREGPMQTGPCPCVWRRPKTGALSDGELKENRWDWRDARAERQVRLAFQSREPVNVQR